MWLDFFDTSRRLLFAKKHDEYIRMDMDVTPLLRKPVIYGSEIADTSFIVVVIMHVVVCIPTVVAGLVALLLPKRSEAHLVAGKIFIVAIVATAITGVVLDIVRLGFFVSENHAKYPGAAMPSSYPARFAFTYAGLCIVYLVHQATPLNSRLTSTFPWTAVGLVASGIAITGLIILRYNPWSGALWMIATFIGASAISGFLKQRSSHSYEDRLHLHRFTLLFLLAFSGWAVWQGFMPAYQHWQYGFADYGGTYRGNLPGEYSSRFIRFLFDWVRPFLLGSLIWLYFVIRRKMKASGLTDLTKS